MCSYKTASHKRNFLCPERDVAHRATPLVQCSKTPTRVQGLLNGRSDRCNCDTRVHSGHATSAAVYSRRSPCLVAFIPVRCVFRSDVEIIRFLFASSRFLLICLPVYPSIHPSICLPAYVSCAYTEYSEKQSAVSMCCIVVMFWGTEAYDT
jgi:hypothetical protein